MVDGASGGARPPPLVCKNLGHGWSMCLGLKPLLVGQRKYKGNTTLIHRKYKGNTRKYKGTTKEILSKYIGSTKEIQRKYKGNAKVLCFKA